MSDFLPVPSQVIAITLVHLEMRLLTGSGQSDLQAIAGLHNWTIQEIGGRTFPLRVM
jgi:hypothetical protein